MFARSVLRTATRQTIRPTTFFTTPAVTAPVQRATFKSSSRNNEPDVPVVSYHEGQRTEETLNVPKSSSTGPVSSPVKDAQKVAIPLNPNVYAQLSPTLAKFTLQGKVAVVTG